MHAKAEIAGLVLAGGRSSRMGADKAFVPFRGKPLVATVIERFAPQAARLAVSANGDDARYAALGLDIVADMVSGQPGPLAGIAAGLAWAGRSGFAWLATVPCDAPFLPIDLVAQLAAGDDARPAIACVGDRLEPLFALWPICALVAVEAALARHERAVWHLAVALEASRVPITGDAGWWSNLNSPHELAEAEATTRTRPGDVAQR